MRYGFGQALLVKINLWLRACRAPSFSASLVPVCLGASLTLYFNEKSNWKLFPIVVIGSIFLHAGTNLINDYYDFLKGLDKNNSFGSSHVLVERLLTPRQILLAAWLSFVIAFLLGLILVAVRGLPLLILGIIGLAGGYFYTGKPLSYKYIGLGDFFVFILMGPLMVIGTYFTLSANYDQRIFYISLPIGCLVSAILNSNNIRDIVYDSRIKIKTLANIIGEKNSKIEYFILITASYLIVFILILNKVLPLYSGLVFLSCPSAIRNILKVKNSNQDNPKTLALIDVQTAELQLKFGSLLIVSLLMARFIG